MVNKVIGLEGHYVKWSPLTILAEEYMERPGLERIIKMCRLKPRSILLDKRKQKLEVCREWIDEYGNALVIPKNKKIHIQLNDLTIPRDRLVITDLYEGLPLQKIGSMSNWAFILAGKEGKSYNDHYIVSFFGLDEYLRTFCFLDGKWFLVPSLYLGFKMLMTLADKPDSNWLTELNYKASVIYPCHKQRMWITGWPNKDEIRKSFSGNIALEKLLTELGV